VDQCQTVQVMIENLGLAVRGWPRRYAPKRCG